MTRILYIGRFELPDKEATANRVVSNAKLLRDIGFQVDLAGWSDNVALSQNWVESQYFGFRCYEKHKSASSLEKMNMLLSASPELELLKKNNYNILIAYDFPAVALRKLMNYCKRNNIKCICDVSEWYTNKNKNPVFSIIRAYDSYLRMKVLHKKADGLFVISKYLLNTYSGQKAILLPPLVDIKENKWKKASAQKSPDNKIHLIYAGWPSKTKERLDIIISAVCKMSDSVELNIYGIDEARYREIYGFSGIINSNVRFFGRVSHICTVEAVKAADFSVVVRESCRKNNAGFPSKMVESISCGTPVLITNISNVSDYVKNGINGFIVSADNFEQDLKNAILHLQDVYVNSNEFDYRNYMEKTSAFVNEVISNG